MSSTNAHATFWQWFQSNLDRFDRFEDEREELMDELSEQLHEVDENLVYEISSDKSAARELIISADGIRESFPAVIKLVESAPDLSGWKITPFRPRVDVEQFRLEFDEREYSASDFYFWLQSDEEHIDLILYVPGLAADNRNQLVNICYILLDMAIGEYDVTTKIRYIDHQPLAPDPKADGLKPLTELPVEFDRLCAAQRK